MGSVPGAVNDPEPPDTAEDRRGEWVGHALTAGHPDGRPPHARRQMCAWRARTPTAVPALPALPGWDLRLPASAFLYLFLMAWPPCL